MLNLSFRCRMYGDRPHDPCSGTTDDGYNLPCECWCHARKMTRLLVARAVTAIVTVAVMLTILMFSWWSWWDLLVVAAACTVNGVLAWLNTRDFKRLYPKP